MSTTPSAKRFVMTASFTLLLALAALLWAATVANTMTLKSSDAAGNALSQAFGTIMAIALWVLLAIVVALAAVRGAMPGWMAMLAIVLVPAAGAATVAVVEIMSQGTEWPVKWPLAIPIVAPGLVVAFALWAYVPSLRALAPAWLVGGFVFASLAALSIAPWPLVRERAHIRRAGPGELQAIRTERRARWSESEQQRRRADFDSIEATAPLYQWLVYTEPGDPLRDRALATIRHLPELQREMEERVRVGDVAAIRELPVLGAEATPALCEAADEAIRFHAFRVRPQRGEREIPYARQARDVEFYMPSVEWLVQRGCPLTQALAELETTANAYPDSPERARFLARLASLRKA